MDFRRRREGLAEGESLNFGRELGTQARACERRWGWHGAYGPAQVCGKGAGVKLGSSESKRKGKP